jgi:hypothetical protein
VTRHESDKEKSCRAAKRLYVAARRKNDQPSMEIIRNNTAPAKPLSYRLLSPPLHRTECLDEIKF